MCDTLPQLKLHTITLRCKICFLFWDFLGLFKTFAFTVSLSEKL